MAPERSLQQRQDALAKANVVRKYRATLKRAIKDKQVDVKDVLLDPPQEVETMKIANLLLAAPGMGWTKVNYVLKNCRISPSKSVGGMSPRQRAELVSMLRR